MHPKIDVGPRILTARPEGPRPTTKPPRPRAAAEPSNIERPTFHVTTTTLNRQAHQLSILIKHDVASFARHQELVVANEQIRRIVSELVELFAPQGENNANKKQQVQAQCKLNELKKIQDDLDGHKDPNASQLREQPSGTQATETATDTTVEGSSVVELVGDKGKSLVHAEASLSSMSDESEDEDTTIEHYLINDDLDKEDVVEGIVEDWKSDGDVVASIDHVEIGKGEDIVYTRENVSIVEFSDVDFKEFREHIYNDKPVEEVSNPEEVPEEAKNFLHKWLKAPPPYLMQKKRYINTRGKYSGQIRSWDFDE
ncbi:hypothetical protein Hanom_Chr00s000006g01613421 [Helianthus anomalus]